MITRFSLSSCGVLLLMVTLVDVKSSGGETERKPGDKGKMDWPRLYFTGQDVPTIRALAKKAPWSESYASIRSWAMDYVNVPYGSNSKPWWYPEKHGNEAYHRGGRSIGGAMRNMAIVYLIDSDKAMGERAKEYLLNICDLPYWTQKNYRDKGMFTYLRSAPYYRNVAETYDLVRPLMTEAEALQARDGMVRNALKMVYHDATRGTYHYRPPYRSNWIGVIVGSAGLLELVMDGEQVSDPLRDKYVEKMREVFATHVKTYGVDGGFTEGLAYLDYEMNDGAMHYLLALRNVKGITFHDNVRNLPLFVAFARFPFDLGGRQRYYFLSFGDSPALSRGPSLQVLLFLSSYTCEPVAQWLVNQSITYKSSGGVFYPCVYDPDLPAGPPQRTFRHFRDTGCVYSRWTWDYRNDVCVASQSGLYLESHQHADQNTFFLIAYGEPVIVEGGIRDYSKYTNCRAKPNDYYMTALGHNTVLLDMDRFCQTREWGKGGKVTRFLGSRHCDVWTGSATEAYQGKLKRFDRTFVHVKPGYLVVCDVLESSGVAYQYDSLLHAYSFGRNDKCITTQGNNITIRALNAGVVVDIVEPQEAGYERGGPYPTLKVKNKGLDTYWASFHPKTKSKNAALLSVYQPFRGEPAGLSKVESISHGSILGTRVRGKDWTDLLFFSPSRSGISEQKVSSDGEFALVRTNPKGDVTRIAVQNGTRFSYDGKTWFSSSQSVSFTVHYVVKSGTIACGVGDMPRDGAKLRLGIPCGRKVREVSLDGEKVKFRLQGDKLYFMVRNSGEILVRVSQ